jgi:hypothetical protein
MKRPIAICLYLLPWPTAVSAATGASPPAAAASSGWIFAASVGWLISGLLVIYLILLQKRWRTAFETKEWMLLPSETGANVVQGLDHLANMVSNTAQQVAERADHAKRAALHASEASKSVREEFAILREELEARQKELKLLQLGQEFHYRRPALMRIIRALEIIDDDMTHRRDPTRTLEGVRVELDECLQDNHVFTIRPEIGKAIAETAGFDGRSARRLETADTARKGTVAEVERPAYVVSGPSGHREVLVPARVTVFV